MLYVDLIHHLLANGVLDEELGVLVEGGERGGRFDRTPTLEHGRRAGPRSPPAARDALEPLDWLVGLDDDAIVATGASYDERVFGEWAWALLGLCHFALGDDAAAADAFRHAEALAPDDAWYGVRRRLAEARARPPHADRTDGEPGCRSPGTIRPGARSATCSASADPGARVLAPDLFWWRFPAFWRYVPANLSPDAEYDWVVVHKGELRAIPRPFLEHVVASMTPVLANEVFVVFAAHR